MLLEYETASEHQKLRYLPFRLDFFWFYCYYCYDHFGLLLMLLMMIYLLKLPLLLPRGSVGLRCCWWFPLGIHERIETRWGGPVRSGSPTGQDQIWTPRRLGWDGMPVKDKTDQHKKQSSRLTHVNSWVVQRIPAKYKNCQTRQDGNTMWCTSSCFNRCPTHYRGEMEFLLSNHLLKFSLS